METPRVLFVCSEISPYLQDSAISNMCKTLPPSIQERGYEIRTFMPRFGNINERRNQLHEVIRLSGMNLIIDDTDHPLIIKVASISALRMQIYFIDNEEFFSRKSMYATDEGAFHPDNDERSIFFARGVLETVRKLRWSPDIVHCHGWFTFMLAIYLRRMYKDDPLYSNSKIILSIYDEEFTEKLAANFKKKAMADGVRAKDLDALTDLDYNALIKACINFSDGVIAGSPNVSQDLLDYAIANKKQVLPYQGEPDTVVDVYARFYDLILSKRKKKKTS